MFRPIPRSDTNARSIRRPVLREPVHRAGSVCTPESRSDGADLCINPIKNRGENCLNPLPVWREAGMLRSVSGDAKADAQMRRGKELGLGSFHAACFLVAMIFYASQGRAREAVNLCSRGRSTCCRQVSARVREKKLSAVTAMSSRSTKREHF